MAGGNPNYNKNRSSPTYVNTGVRFLDKDVNENELLNFSGWWKEQFSLFGKK